MTTSLKAFEPLRSEAKILACSAGYFGNTSPALVPAISSRKCLARCGSAEARSAFAQTVLFLELEPTLGTVFEPLICANLRQ
jgi:hypothetical protein